MAFSNQLDFSFRFFKYWLTAVDDHSLHPPFIYRFYQKVIEPSGQIPVEASTEALRKQFLQNDTLVSIQDPGAGSSVLNEDKRSIRQIAKHSLSATKISRLLYLCGSYISAKHVVELGTSLGINTRYLAQIDTATKIHTFEGVEPIFKLAYGHLDELDNVECQLGNIDEKLPELIDQLPQIDLAYIDANHTYEATMRYYSWLVKKRSPSSIIVVGDIHWSEGMEKAWKEIISLKEVTLSVDIFHCGLLFFLPVREKQDYVIWF